jgi:hypothetical protein
VICEACDACGALTASSVDGFIVSSVHRFIVSSFHRFIGSSVHRFIDPSVHRHEIASTDGFMIVVPGREREVSSSNRNFAQETLMLGI